MLGFRILQQTRWDETQRLIDNMFLFINKEEMNIILERDFVMLRTRMEREPVVQKEPLKKHVEQLKKELEPILLPQKTEEEEEPSKKLKVRGSYTSWIIPSFWDPIFGGVK